MQEKAGIVITEAYFKEISKTHLAKEDREILQQLDEVVKKVTVALEKFRFAEAADTIYEFVWRSVADVYIEQVKERKDQNVALAVLRSVILNSLKLLHPFMPFVTEAIWQEFPNLSEKNLITAKWPESI